MSSILTEHLRKHLVDDHQIQFRTVEGTAFLTTPVNQKSTKKFDVLTSEGLQKAIAVRKSTNVVTRSLVLPDIELSNSFSPSRDCPLCDKYSPMEPQGTSTPEEHLPHATRLPSSRSTSRPESVKSGQTGFDHAPTRKNSSLGKKPEKAVNMVTFDDWISSLHIPSPLTIHEVCDDDSSRVDDFLAHIDGLGNPLFALVSVGGDSMVFQVGVTTVSKECERLIQSGTIEIPSRYEDSGIDVSALIGSRIVGGVQVSASYMIMNSPKNHYLVLSIEVGQLEIGSDMNYDDDEGSVAGSDYTDKPSSVVDPSTSKSGTSGNVEQALSAWEPSHNSGVSSFSSSYKQPSTSRHDPLNMTTRGSFSPMGSNVSMLHSSKSLHSPSYPVPSMLPSHDSSSYSFGFPAFRSTDHPMVEAPNSKVLHDVDEGSGVSSSSFSKIGSSERRHHERVPGRFESDSIIHPMSALDVNQQHERMKMIGELVRLGVISVEEGRKQLGVHQW
jgi:hypothetical protein